MSESTPKPETIFDPGEHTVEEVNAYLAAATDDAEKARVLEAERTGKARVTVNGLAADNPPADTPPAPDGTPATTPPDAAPEKVAPKRYTVGAEAERAYYGILDPTGAVTPIDGEPEPGQRGVIIVQRGDTITPAIAAALQG